MEVVEKYKKSNLNNSDVKWYLFDDKLWITKYKTYFFKTNPKSSTINNIKSFRLLNFKGKDSKISSFSE